MSHSQMKLGKRAPRRDPRTLKLAKYLPIVLPPAPDLVDHTCGRKQWGMCLNDRIGCCTIAGVAHLVQLFTLNTTGLITPSDQAVLQYYEKWDGYSPINPASDQGGVEIDVLNDWRRDGFDGHTIVAYVSVDPHNMEHVKQATSLFGGLYIGLALPISAQNQNVWDVVANDGGLWGGHCVVLAGYNHVGPMCITWGEIKQMSWAFFARYADEAYAVLGTEWLAHFGGTPIDLAALQNDLVAISN